MTRFYRRHFCFILWLLMFFALWPQPVYADDTKAADAAICSEEKMQEIEKNLQQSASDGLKKSQELLNTYNSFAHQYVNTCNAKLNTGKPVYWTTDAAAAALAKSPENKTLITDLSQYRYTGVTWSAETPPNEDCAKLAKQADAALQNYNNSRITTTALLGKAHGYDMPRACICSENAASPECVAYATADEEPKTSEDGCKMFNEYMIELATCPLCPLFEVILNTDSKVAHVAWVKFAMPLRGVVAVFFLVFLALETLKLVASMGGASTSSYLKSIFALGLKVAIALILLTNSSYIYGYFISPVIKGGLEMGQEFLKMGSENAQTVTNCQLSTSSAIFGSIQGGELDSSILSDIYETIHCFNNSALTLPAIGKSLMCHGWENNGGFPDLEMWIAGALNYLFGLMIWLAVAFYLIDCTVQLGMICAFVPMFIAFWPFKMTQRYSYIGVKIIFNTFFNFVLMGIIMFVGIEIVTFALSTGNNNIEVASLIAHLNNLDIDAEKLKKVVNLDGGAMLGLIACCIMALKMISIANSASSKFSSGSGMDIGRKTGGLAGSAAKTTALGVGGAGLTFAGATAKKIGRKVSNTDAGRYVARKYRSGVNAVRGAFGLSQRQTGSGVSDEEVQVTTPETTPSRNQNSNTPQTIHGQQRHSQNQSADNSQIANNGESPVYNNSNISYKVEDEDENKGNANTNAHHISDGDGDGDGDGDDEDKGNTNTDAHHISDDKNQNVTRKRHTFGKGQTDE